MFSGTVQELGEIKNISNTNGILEIVISSKDLIMQLKPGDSVAVDGCCQTVIEVDKGNFVIQAVSETLSKTNFLSYEIGFKVNLEPSLNINSKLDGHFVSGHIDSIGEIKDIKVDKENKIVSITFSESLGLYIAPKGSIAVNGVSLTVINSQNNSFSFALIPYTSKNTNLGFMTIGDKVNLEIDLLSRYIVNYLKKSNDLVKAV